MVIGVHPSMLSFSICVSFPHPLCTLGPGSRILQHRSLLCCTVIHPVGLAHLGLLMHSAYTALRSGGCGQGSVKQGYL